ncbi:DUF2080 family transposase-associated protein [Methanocaldococcus vulcanius]|nr:DUF2080 family transposase-associated protein [Methanocaldococcus vulcanius]
MVRVKKKAWRKPRDVVIGFVAVCKANGNTVIPKPTLPPDYVGKKVIIIPIEDEDEEFDVVDDN